MARAAALPIVTAEGGLTRYLEEIRRFPMLEPQEEYMLATRWRAVLWFAAGLVALAAGIMWGARSNVSFALEIIALKALPVLILGGLTSIPGAIVGGVIIGVGEKLGEFYWGPLFGSGIESWLAYMIALVFLLFRPQGLFGERIIERV